MSHIDEGDIEVLVKRSDDRGITWGPAHVAVGNAAGVPNRPDTSRGQTTYGNVVPVYLAATGETVLVFAVNNTYVYTTRSRDGIVWEPALEITESVRAPGWGWLAPGPGHGLEMRHGRYAGRLVVPFNHYLERSTVVQTVTVEPSDPSDLRTWPRVRTTYTVTNPAAAPPRRHEAPAPEVTGTMEAVATWTSLGVPQGLSPFEMRNPRSAVMISDDGGRSWRVGRDVPALGGNEVQVAELDTGELVASFRVVSSLANGCRHFASSWDGGDTWTLRQQQGEEEGDCVVVDPGCQGSLHALGSWLVASGPGDKVERQNGTIYASADGGERWHVLGKIPVPPEDFQSAYSDIAVWPGELSVVPATPAASSTPARAAGAKPLIAEPLGPGPAQIGVIYEFGDRHSATLAFARYSVEVPSTSAVRY